MKSESAMSDSELGSAGTLGLVVVILNVVAVGLTYEDSFLLSLKPVLLWGDH